MDKEIFEKMTMSELIVYLIDTFHAPFKIFLENKTEKMVSFSEEYSEDYPKVSYFKDLFYQFRNELVKHVKKEDEIMFPTILKYENSDDNKPDVWDVIREKGKSVDTTQMGNEHNVILYYLNSILDLLENCWMEWRNIKEFEEIKKSFDWIKKTLAEHINLENKYVYKKWDDMKKESREK